MSDGKSPTTAAEDAVWQMWLDGKRVGTIAREVGLSYGRAWTIIERRKAKIVKDRDNA